MTYQQTLDFLFAQLPMYQRIGPAAYKKDLSNTLALCDALGNPQDTFKSIHVAGTNGKGSTSHMLASILQENGLKTGLYTSPHLIDFRERIRVDGEMVTEAFVIDFVDRISPELQRIKPSFFEITVVMAFDWFRYSKIEIAVIETGLGGRLDSTNVITPILSVITNIGYDHADMLGETLPEIAAEKAGIIKPNVPVVIGEYQEEVQFVFEKKAEDSGSQILLASQMPMTTIFYECDLKGIYQIKNIQTVRAAISVLNTIGIEISPISLHNGFAHVSKNTGLMGRWQQIQSKPTVICDTGHNAEGMAEIVSQLKQEKYKKLRIVFGQVVGKDPGKVLSLLPKDAEFYFCQPSIPRALPVEDLIITTKEIGLKGKAYPTVVEAYQHALLDSDSLDFIFVGGSTFVVADLLTSLQKSK